jgi:hypothetical protein
MLSSEHSWLFDCEAGQQVPDYLLDAGTYACIDGGGMSAGFDLSSVAQEPSSTSTTQMNNNQLPLWFDDTALSIDQDVDFASLFTGASVSAPNPNLNPAVVAQDVGSLPAYQEIDTELFYCNAQSSLVHQYTDPAVVSQGANLYDTSAALSMQHVPDPSLCEEPERSLLEGAACVLGFGAGLVTASGTEFGNVDEGLQLDREQPQQDRRHEPIEPLADTRERLSKQDERIWELELALQLLQQVHRTCPELPQMLVSIP